MDFPNMYKMYNETAQKSTVSRNQDLQSTQKKNTSKRVTSTNSSPTKDDQFTLRNPVNPFTAPMSMAETKRSEPRRSLFEEIDAIKTLNNAACCIQRSFRRFLE